MAATVLAPTSLTLVTLSGHPQATDLSGVLRTSAVLPSRHVACRAGTAGERNLTAALIDDAITEADRAVLLIAHGVGCAAAAWWARLSPRTYVERVAGALLIEPEGKVGRSGFSSPRSTLPFPSLVVGSSDEAQRLSGEWGSRLLDGPLPEATAHPSHRLRSMVARFTRAIVEKDLRKADRLLSAVGDC